MKRVLLLVLVSFLSISWAVAQAPKWMKKTRKAVFSIVTYNDKDEILQTGNGFFVDSKGVGVSKYTLFENAHRAVVIDTDGKSMNVESIMGVDDMYDVIKFKVDIPKSVEALIPAVGVPKEGETVYLLGYASQQKEESEVGKVKEVSKVGNYNYYTLNLPLKEKMISCPVMNEKGEVLGLSQEAVGNENFISYAVDVNYIINQSISALSFNDLSLKKIGIKKALPEKVDDALIFLYLASSQVQGEEYLNLLSDFIASFPQHTEGYVRRANYVAFQGANANMKEVENDMNKALSVAENKDEVYYNYALLIYNYALTKIDDIPSGWSFSDAENIINKGLAIKNLPVYKQLKGDIKFAMTNYSDAFDLYQEVNQSDMASPASFYSAAKAKELMGADAKEILVLLDSCVSRLPEHVSETEATYFLERAQLLSSMEEYRKAMTDYDSFYNATGGKVNDVFYYLRGQVARDSKLFQKALDDFSEALLLNPNEVIYHIELGATNIRVGRNEDAQQNFLNAIKLNPEYSEAYRLLGVAQMQMKNKSEACKNFHKAKELNDTLADDLIKRYCE